MTSPPPLPPFNPGAALGAIASMLNGPAQVAGALAGALSKRSLSGCCEIPPPCWEPRPVGTCFLQITPGGSATIRVHVSNCGWTRQVMTITALGRLGAWMTFAPTTWLLGPQERGTILVTVHAPAAATIGAALSGPLIIRGCRDHFARIEVSITDCATCANCCDVTVNDCADQIHHWYDHFYCPRPCNTVKPPGRTGTTGSTTGTTGTVVTGKING
jgi:hypothetical protein